MPTPRKNYNYSSPYAKSINTQQYPSQLEEYISLDMGGRSQPRQNARDSISNATKNSKCNQRRGQTNYFGNSYSKNHGAGGNQQKQWSPRKNYNNGDKSEHSISSYLHPSMTEDPWMGLIKRLDAIESSSISLKIENGSYNYLESMETVCGEEDSDQHPV